MQNLTKKSKQKVYLNSSENMKQTTRTKTYLATSTISNQTKSEGECSPSSAPGYPRVAP